MQTPGTAVQNLHQVETILPVVKDLGVIDIAR